MAPVDDPVTAEYDVYLTPPTAEQIYLLQYLNRPRDRPYSDRYGSRPQDLRIKPNSGFLEMDVQMHAGLNFNKYQGLKWGDAISTAKNLQNDTGTFGPASGFAVPRGRQGSRGPLKDKVEREHQIMNDIVDFSKAQNQGKVLDTQTLGGKILRHDTVNEGAQPVYFLGAFQGNELHLSKMNATIQMRPQFHHIDAEDQRARVAASRASAADAEARPPAVARALQQSYKDLSDDKDKDAPERKMRKLLTDAEEERWLNLQYIDEHDDIAYDAFHDRMFVHEPISAPKLKSVLDGSAFIDSVSAPRHDSPGRRRKRPPKKKGAVDEHEHKHEHEHDDDDEDDDQRHGEVMQEG